MRLVAKKIFQNVLLVQDGILGIFQKLISMKNYDHQGFYLLNSLIENVPRFVHLAEKYFIFILFL